MPPIPTCDEDRQPRKRRRGSAPRSCAECRRLKLRCDRQVPCSSCVKRGCGAICPDGCLTTGQGNRFVLASTEELHDKIQTLCYRIRSLEDGLRESHNKTSSGHHPLLTEDLLAIKAPLQREARPDTKESAGDLKGHSQGSDALSVNHLTRFVSGPGARPASFSSASSQDDDDDLSSISGDGVSIPLRRLSTRPRTPSAITYGHSERPGWSRRASVPTYAAGATAWSPPVQLSELFPGDDSFVPASFQNHPTSSSPLAPHFFGPPAKVMQSDAYWSQREFSNDLPPLPPTPLPMVTQEGWESYLPY